MKVLRCPTCKECLDVSWAVDAELSWITLLLRHPIKSMQMHRWTERHKHFVDRFTVEEL